MAILTSKEVKMTSLLEKTIRIIAPHRCFDCSKYDNVLCLSCLNCLPKIEIPACLLCGAVCDSWAPCNRCRPKCCFDAAYSIFYYEDVIARCIRAYKFSHAREAYTALVSGLDIHLPYFSRDWVIVSVPTIARNIRQRGYDHARILAKEFAYIRGLEFKELIFRSDSLEQKVANRQQRKKQISGLLYTKQQSQIQGEKFLIIDDVCTTGSTLNSAAKALKDAGASQVHVAAVAWKR